MSVVISDQIVIIQIKKNTIEIRADYAPREGLGAVRTDVGFLHAALVRAHVVAHPVFPLEALLADGAEVGLLVRVRQAVAVQVVDVSEGFPTGLAGVVLPHHVGVAGVGVWILWISSRERHINMLVILQ